MNRDEPCEKCGKKPLEHTFREWMTCLYGGLPLKDGGVFTRQTADEIVDKMVERLEGRPEGE